VRAGPCRELVDHESSDAGQTERNFIFLAVAVGIDDKGKTGASAEKIEIIRVRPVLTDTQDRFMLIGRDNR
jgi:hypothetical protein